MSRAVADTNSVISYFLNRGSISGTAFVALRSQYTLLASKETLDELYAVLMRAKFRRIGMELRSDFFRHYCSAVEIIETDIEINVCRDPGDNKFLNLAVGGGADLILTGDSDLLVLHPFRGIDILTPGDYLARPPR